MHESGYSANYRFCFSITIIYYLKSLTITLHAYHQNLTIILGKHLSGVNILAAIADLSVALASLPRDQPVILRAHR